MYVLHTLTYFRDGMSAARKKDGLKCWDEREKDLARGEKIAEEAVTVMAAAWLHTYHVSGRWEWETKRRRCLVACEWIETEATCNNTSPWSPWKFFHIFFSFLQKYMVCKKFAKLYIYRRGGRQLPPWVTVVGVRSVFKNL
jgi:hypothetical protein